MPKELQMGRPPRGDNNKKQYPKTGGAAKLQLLTDSPYHDSVTKALISKMAQGNLLHSGPSASDKYKQLANSPYKRVKGVATQQRTASTTVNATKGGFE